MKCSYVLDKHSAYPKSAAKYLVPYDSKERSGEFPKGNSLWAQLAIFPSIFPFTVFLLKDKSGV